MCTVWLDLDHHPETALPQPCRGCRLPGEDPLPATGPGSRCEARHSRPTGCVRGRGYNLSRAGRDDIEAQFMGMRGFSVIWKKEATRGRKSRSVPMTPVDQYTLSSESD